MSKKIGAQGAPLTGRDKDLVVAPVQRLLKLKPVTNPYADGGPK